MITKTMKMAAFLVAALGLVAAMALPSSADAHVVEWDGNRGLDSIGECPGEDGYLHWILTPGGRSNVTGATLEVDGETYDGFRNGNGGGAFHFLVPEYDGSGIGSAVATVEGTLGANALLTISDGCAGDGEEPSS